MISTNEDLNQWLITDQPTQLREWEAGLVHLLPERISSTDYDYTIGTAEDSWLRLHDPTGRVSRQHARLTLDCRGYRMVSDWRSKNGITEDGARRPLVPLMPGVELGMGGITLIVESPLLCMLRELLARLIGWSDERRVNLALRSIRMAATRRESLQLSGENAPTLLSVARLLHLRTLGSDRPFAICARRPRKANPQRWATYGGVARYDSGIEALAAANGGTLCVGLRPPHDLAQVIEAHRDPSSRVQLIVCTRTCPHDPLIAPIVMPPLAERTHELDQIIDAYAVDAGGTLTASDRAWIRSHESQTLAEIERATQRLVTTRLHGITPAAELLGLSHSSLSEWVARRMLDVEDESDDEED
jgi:hypothetical protein